jgi:hypothetical protein
MKKNYIQKLHPAVLLVTVMLLITSCAPEMKITSSWANRQTKTKSSPTIMVAVLGKVKPESREAVEKSMVKKLKKSGFNAVPASSLFKPGVKQDSAELVSILRKNNIDMLLTNAVVNIIKDERFIPGAVQQESVQAPASRYATPYYYYNYYDTYSLRTVDAPQTPGVTVTDVKVMIESNLYEVATPSLIWHAQSTVYSDEPSKKFFNAFSKMAVDDIEKNKILKK